MTELESDHNGQPIPATFEMLYSIYAYQVDCPHCGAGENEYCVETREDGPTDVVRSPHMERAELAREVFGSDTDD